MAEVTVTKPAVTREPTSEKAAVNKPMQNEVTHPHRFDDFFAPVFPTGIVGRKPLALWKALNDEMDRSFAGFGSGFGGFTNADFWTPVVEVQSTDGKLVVTAELPGLEKEDVKVEMTNEALVIQGERKMAHTEDHDGFHKTERSYGKFYRSVALPEGTKTDEATAELTNGVLKVSIPVLETKKFPREVPVETGAAVKAA